MKITKEQLPILKDLLGWCEHPSQEKQDLLDAAYDLVRRYVSNDKDHIFDGDEVEAKQTSSYKVGIESALEGVAKELREAAGKAWAADLHERAETLKGLAKLYDEKAKDAVKDRIDHYFNYVSQFDPPHVVEQMRKTFGRKA